MNPYKCLVLDNNVQCSFPNMKGHDYCMFHCDILVHQKSLPKLYECVEEKLREGFKFGTMHIPHVNYNWSSREIINSIHYLYKHHNLQCKVGITNTMVYSSRFKTKEDYINYQRRKQESWLQYHLDKDSDSFMEFLIECALVPILIMLIAYVWYFISK